MQNIHIYKMLCFHLTEILTAKLQLISVGNSLIDLPSSYRNISFLVRYSPSIGLRISTFRRSRRTPEATNVEFFFTPGISKYRSSRRPPSGQLSYVREKFYGALPMSSRQHFRIFGTSWQLQIAFALRLKTSF